jgi:hypothetical protein
MPAVWLGLGVVIGLSSTARGNLSLTTLALMSTAGVAAAAGSALATLLLRRHLRDDAGVADRRAFLVGLGSLALFMTIRPFLTRIGVGGEYLLMAASGAALAAAVHFPWLQRRRPSASTLHVEA